MNNSCVMQKYIAAETGEEVTGYVYVLPIGFVVIILRFVSPSLHFVNITCCMNTHSHTHTYLNRYAVITNMFLHSFWQHDPQAPRKVVIQANWYEQVGINPVNGLPQIEYNENFGSCSLAFLDDCIPENCTFFPSSPWNETCHRFDVVLHHSSSWYV